MPQQASCCLVRAGTMRTCVQAGAPLAANVYLLESNNIQRLSRIFAPKLCYYAIQFVASLNIELRHSRLQDAWRK